MSEVCYTFSNHEERVRYLHPRMLVVPWSLQNESERMTKIKICGITTSDDAQVAVEAGADMIGLNFYPPSPRYVTPEQAHSIVAHLPPGCSAVGVFVNENLDTVTYIAQTSGVHMVQLHGTESPALCQQLPWPVIKTFRFTAQVQPEIMQQYSVAAMLI